jgi:hypothetical protein
LGIYEIVEEIKEFFRVILLGLWRMWKVDLEVLVYS